MPPKKSNLNNARSKAARQRRLERAHKSVEQRAERNEAQRIRIADIQPQQRVAGSASSIYKGNTGSSGFAAGLEPEEVIGASNADGVLVLLMKWKGLSTPELVKASEANVYCPNLVIQFYEKHLQFYPTIASTSSGSA